METHGETQGGPDGSNKPALTFEQALGRLEEIVRLLENGSLSLTESIERYKEAMQLVHYCRQQLDQAELEIERLVDGGQTVGHTLEGENES
ncbi:MAG: exodeoxyribonuclease VII small subunit [Alicyclobacillus herbarius]|uniref:exodeoxyribonuclease VII small subunit n=1 Tax=Alicyclobacillus herbarius TaxID=122960 RepID=UPI0005595490|nr:exodeoxyribonuclease VII small subunit [Alicyclobacillus herbarius]MCL6631661.1 exodeoxyribonuclease VII small subunit [Alicyclobacillus herbarius]